MTGLAAALCASGGLPRPVGAVAPPGRYETTDETVTDTVTLLVWQRHVEAQTRTWDDAKSYCAALNLAEHTGDWRLPTIRELRSLLDLHQTSAIDPTAFPGTPPGFYWSTTPSVVTTGSAWGVDLPAASSHDKEPTGQGYSRCVRPMAGR